MKKDIHPTYYTDAKINCSCGASLVVGSTKKEIHVEICSACHPFFTGKKKIIDTTGIIERFHARGAKTKSLQEEKQKTKTASLKKAVKKTVTGKKRPVKRIKKELETL